jgi:dethiobiotin synthetase/adenosylmethionine--8-amino-7-oxononanoate aminotransferase
MHSSMVRRSFTSNVDALHGMTHLIFGANTDVGKSVIAAGLVRACGGLSLWDKEHASAHYIKPLQCGGSDQSFVQRHAQKEIASSYTLFEWATPTSPHAAARREGRPVSDVEVTTALHHCLDELRENREHLPIWIETAGGVLSPSSSSPDNNEIQHSRNTDGWGWMTQGDLYREFRADMDVIMIGDGRLGGISTTLSSLESLLSRGYNVAGVVLIDKGFSNHKAIQEYASR